MSYHRLARNYADQNDINRASANYSLALQNAAPRQVADIAADYAAFLTGIGDLHKAELMLRQALTQSPDDTELTRMLGRCLVRQEKMTEGLRYLKSISTEAEAKAEIAAIYREQGNTDMLVAVERTWEAPKQEAPRPTMARPEAVRPEPALIAATTPKPATVRPDVARPAAKPETIRPEPALVAMATPKPITAPPLPVARTLPSTPAPMTTRIGAAPREVAVNTPTSATSPLSKSEFFDSRVPIPVPKATTVTSASVPVIVAANTPKSVPIASAPAPVPAQRVQEGIALANPIGLAVAPVPMLSRTGVNESPKPAVAVQARRHYVVNAGTSSDLESILPVIRPAAALVPVDIR